MTRNGPSVAPGRRRPQPRDPAAERLVRIETEANAFATREWVQDVIKEVATKEDLKNAKTEVGKDIESAAKGLKIWVLGGVLGGILAMIGIVFALIRIFKT